jgi:hypothetical protein
LDRMYRLLAFGYLPKELPPVFYSGSFAKEIKRNFSNIDSFTNNKWSVPCRFLLRQRKIYRRSLAIPNPNVIIQISNKISLKYEEISKHLEKSKLSVSKPRFRRKTKFFRAVSSHLIGNQIKEKKLSLRAVYPVILKCDVKNYYKSIYTHSIPWALYGKRYAKQNKREDNLGNNLDELTRLGQDGQTIGIPVGPDTSFILAELILASIDNELSFDQSKSLRFYDDYEFGCKSETEAENILDKIENILSLYELELNHDKTKIIKGPYELDTSWNYLIKQFTKNMKINKNEDLIDLFNFTSKLARENESDFVFKYFIQRMRMNIIEIKHWETWQNILFICGQSEFGNLREIYEQLDLYKRIGYQLDLKGLNNLLEIKADKELKGGISSELSWILFGYLKFGIKPNREFLVRVIDKGDDISRIIAIKLAIKKNVGIKRKLRDLLDLLDSEAATSEHWLLFWELYVNDWLSNQKLKDEILKVDIFNFLDNSKISFLRDPQVDILEVPIPFKKRIEELRGKQELEKLLKEIRDTFGDIPTDDMEGPAEGDIIGIDSDDESEYE